MRPGTWLKFPAALWWGSLTMLGFFVVPMLFGHLPSKQLAGNMAARLFEAQTWVSVACGALLLLLLRFDQGSTASNAASSQFHASNEASNTVSGSINTAYTAILFIAFGMLLALLITFGVAPRIVARDNLMLWHSIGSAMYLAQWVCAGVVLWKVR